MLTLAALALAHAQPAQTQPTYVAWCDGQRATLVARLDDRGPVAAAGLPRPAEEQLARDVAGIAFHRADRPGSIAWTRPFTAPVENETGGTPWAAGHSALGNPDARKVVLGACQVPGLLVSAPARPAEAGRTQLALATDTTWVGADVHASDAGTEIALTVVSDVARHLRVELSYFGC
jgi:hypothetical protein